MLTWILVIWATSSGLCFLIFFFSILISLEYSWFTMLCWFQVYSSYVYTHICSFLDSFLMQLITEHWVAFPVLSLLVIYLICRFLYMFIPSSWFIPHLHVFFLQSELTSSSLRSYPFDCCQRHHRLEKVSLLNVLSCAFFYFLYLDSSEELNRYGICLKDMESNI